MSRRMKHKWQCRPRFRRGAFGWRSQPAVQRVKETVSEINKAGPNDPLPHYSQRRASRGGRSPRREVAREQRDRDEKGRNDAVRRDVSRVDTEEKRGHEPHHNKGARTCRCRPLSP